MERLRLILLLKQVPHLSWGRMLMVVSCLLLSAFAAAIPAAAQSSARSLLAEAGAAEEPGFAGSKVKVRMPDDLKPPADAVFELPVAGEKITKPEVCLDASGKRAFAVNPQQPFRENWAMAARCGQNIADATVLEEKIADMKSNIAYVDMLLDSMGITKTAVDAATKLVGLQFIVIPLGGEIAQQYKQVTGVQMQCVEKGRGSMPPGPIVPVGRGAYTTGVRYIRVTAKQIKAIAKIRAEIKALSKQLNDSIDKGEIGVWQGTKLGFALTGLVSDIKENTISLTAAAFEKYFSRADKTHNSSFLFTEAAPDDLSKMPKGMRNPSGWPGWAQKLMSVAGVDAQDLKIGALALWDEVLKIAMVPEQKTLADTRAELAKKIADFQKKKSIYEQTLHRLLAQLASLEKDGYGCADSEIVERTRTTARSESTPAIVSTYTPQSCGIRLSASVPAKVKNSAGITVADTPAPTPFSVSGEVSANEFCFGDITVLSTLSGDTKKIKAGESSAFRFGPALTPHGMLISPFSDDKTVYRRVEVTAYDSCGYTNTVAVETCSETNTDGFYNPRALGGDTCPYSRYPHREYSPSRTSPDTATLGPDPGFPAPPERIVKDSVTFVPDPDYVAQMQKERRFTPTSPFSPLDDFRVTFTTVACQPVSGPRIGAALVTIDDAGKELIVSVSEPTVMRQEGNNKTYSALFSGYPRGITQNKIETLIESIAAGRRVWVRLSPAGSMAQTEEKIDMRVPFTNCAKLWGSGRHKLVFSRLDYLNQYALWVFMNDVESVRTDGFEKIDPFRQPQYKESFSHLADLRLYDPTEWNRAAKALLGIRAYGERRLTLRTYNKVVKNFAGAGTSCQSDSGAITVALGAPPKPGFAASTGRGLFLDKDVEAVYKGLMFFGLFLSPLPIVVLHEFGHVFAGLNDEYLSRSGSGFELRLKMPLRNCSIMPRTEWQLNGIRYGDTKYSGCTFPAVFRGGTPTNPKRVPIYRPSDKSMMKAAQSGEWRFNVVSCGYIIAAIKGGQAQDYWSECMRYDTVKPTETAAAPFGRFLSWFAHGALPAGEHLVAQVGSVVTSDQQSPPYLIIESFDPNNPWGEIVEVVPDDDTAPVIPPAGSSEIQVISPQAGEIWNAGALMTVLWSASLPPDAPVRISLIRGRATNTALTNQLTQGITTPNDGSEVWVIPPNVRPGFYFLEITCAAPNAQCASGASPAFRVVGAEIDSSGMAVDLKVDGADTPPPVKRGTKLVLSWEVANIGSCYANFPTPGINVIRENGRTELIFDRVQPKIYELVCYNEDADYTKSDAVVITPIF